MSQNSADEIGLIPWRNQSADYSETTPLWFLSSWDSAY